MSNNLIILEKRVGKNLTCNRLSQHVPIHWLKVKSYLIILLNHIFRLAIYMYFQHLGWHTTLRLSLPKRNRFYCATARKRKGEGILRMSMEKQQRRTQTQKVHNHFHRKRSKHPQHCQQCHHHIFNFIRITWSRSEDRN